MNRQDQNLGYVIVALVLVLILQAIALFWAVRKILLFFAPTAGERIGKTSLFGAPASTWWEEIWEWIIWQLEDRTHVDFTSSPEGLFIASFLLTGGIGLVVALITSSFHVPFLWVFIPFLLAGFLSAWQLSQPAVGWWQPVEPEKSEDELKGREGIILGQLLKD
jgi:hypothetical protein